MMFVSTVKPRVAEAQSTLATHRFGHLKVRAMTELSDCAPVFHPDLSQPGADRAATLTIVFTYPLHVKCRWNFLR